MAQESWKRDQDETGCEHPEGPILCANNCGFFGCAATMNLCSKCYRDIVLKQSGGFSSKSMGLGLGDKSLILPTPVEKKGIAMVTDVPMPIADDTSIPLAEARQDEQHPGASSSEINEQPVSTSASRTVNRCFICRRRVGLTGFKCRCGDIFCSVHRYSDKHSCSFDYKAAARDAIAKANPIVKPGKIEKI